jgi:hypothetical protein
VEVPETHAFAVEAIEVGRFENRIAVTGQVAEALIVRQQEDNVG